MFFGDMRKASYQVDEPMRLAQLGVDGNDPICAGTFWSHGLMYTLTAFEDSSCVVASVFLGRFHWDDFAKAAEALEAFKERCPAHGEHLHYLSNCSLVFEATLAKDERLPEMLSLFSKVSMDFVDSNFYDVKAALGYPSAIERQV